MTYNVLRHADGTIWARGFMDGKTMIGFWKWFRKDGSLMRSGSFDDHGKQVGEWTTSTRGGKVVKVTTFKPTP